jgi:hypothetical protein
MLTDTLPAAMQAKPGLSHEDRNRLYAEAIIEEQARRTCQAAFNVTPDAVTATLHQPPTSGTIIVVDTALVTIGSALIEIRWNTYIKPTLHRAPEFSLMLPCHECGRLNRPTRPTSDLAVFADIMANPEPSRASWSHELCDHCLHDFDRLRMTAVRTPAEDDHLARLVAILDPDHNRISYPYGHGYRITDPDDVARRQPALAALPIAV